MEIQTDPPQTTSQLQLKWHRLIGDVSHSNVNQDSKLNVIKNRVVQYVVCYFTVDVAIIDEIQLLKDPSRGWAWTRAFLGINADEIHVCGEAGTKELLERLVLTTGEYIEYNHYDRLTKLSIEDKAVESFETLQDGDCIVCFNKTDIYTVSREIESM